MKKLFGKKANKPASPKPVAKPTAPISPLEAKPAPADPPIKTSVPPVKSALPVRPQKPAVIFSLHAPTARQVSVCGDFNGWSPEAAPMTRQNDGRWSTALALPPGRHQYKFVADGEWLHDPKAPEVLPNNFGSLNSVIEVQA